MDQPAVKHPKKFLSAGGVYFQVVSYMPLTDSQAETALRLFLRNNRFKKKPKKGMTITVSWLSDTSLLGD
jgi:hypothetical protein